MIYLHPFHRRVFSYQYPLEWGRGAEWTRVVGIEERVFPAWDTRANIARILDSLPEIPKEKYVPVVSLSPSELCLWSDIYLSKWGDTGVLHFQVLEIAASGVKMKSLSTLTQWNEDSTFFMTMTDISKKTPKTRTMIVMKNGMYRKSYSNI